MSELWELTWIEFYLPDGYKAMYAIDGDEIKMSVDEEDIPPGLTVRERLDQCYDHYFNFLYKR